MKSNLVQNLASGGAMLPVCVFFMYLSLQSSAAERWARIGMNSLESIACLLMCYTIVWFMRDKHSGHQGLHAYFLANFVGSVFVHLWVSYKWSLGLTASMPYAVVVFQGSTLVSVCLYVFTTRHDLRITYQRSEEKRRALLHRIENAHQAVVMLDYKVDNPPEKSSDKFPEFMELTTNVGRGR